MRILEVIRQNQVRVCISLTILALLLWIHAMLGAELNFGFFGLISSYPVTFFIALALLTVSFSWLCFSGQNVRWLLLLQLIFLIVSLYLTPLALEGTPRISDTYMHFGLADIILREHRLFPEFLLYHNWPGFPILIAGFMEIMGTHDPFYFLAWFPICFKLLCLLPFYHLILRNTTEPHTNRWWMAVWIIYVANWIYETDHLCPQAMGFFLFLVCLSLLLPRSQERLSGATNALSPSTTVLLIVVFASLVTTHLLTSIALLAMAVALFLGKRVRSPTLLVLFAILIATWLIYGAYYQFQGQLPAFVRMAFRLDIIYKFVDRPYALGTSEALHFVIRQRIFFTLFVGILGFIGAMIRLRQRKLWHGNDLTMLLLFSFVILTPVFFYGGGILHRTFLFLLVPLAYFASHLISKKRWAIVLTAALIIAIPGHMVAHYGNEVFNYYSPAELAGNETFYELTTHGHIVAVMSGYLSQMRYEERYDRFHLMNPIREYSRDYLLSEAEAEAWIQALRDSVFFGARLGWPPPRYVYLTRHDKIWYDFFVSRPEWFYEHKAALDNSADYNLFYVNPDFSLYIKE